MQGTNLRVVESLQGTGVGPDESSRDGILLVPMTSPYIITGGMVVIKYLMQSPLASVTLELLKPDGSEVRVYRAAPGEIGAFADSINLFDAIDPQGSFMLPSFVVRLSLASGGDSSGVILTSFSSQAIFQFDPLGIPRLRCGDNTITLRKEDQVLGEGRVSVRYVVEEMTSGMEHPRVTVLHPPVMDVASSPRRLAFAWEPPNGASEARSVNTMFK
ncbi:MAG: hypothetical protein IPI01_21010 [Ignavibacteriae bacterium]|nr:hypothetical protein [Ignavibacteriota bacterium]